LTGGGSSQAEKRQDDADHDHKTDQIDNVVHVVLLSQRELLTELKVPCIARKDRICGV
jgi:hypothetical protein